MKTPTIESLAVIFFFVLSIALCFGSYIFEDRLAWTRPLHVTPELGYQHPVNIHGKIVYVTKHEKLLVDWMLPLGILAGLTGVAVRQLIRRDKSNPTGRRPT